MNKYTNFVIYPDNEYQKAISKHLYFEKEDTIFTDAREVKADMMYLLADGYQYRIRMRGLPKQYPKAVLQIAKKWNLSLSVSSNQLNWADLSLGFDDLTVFVKSKEEYERICKMPKKYTLMVLPEVLEEIYDDVTQRRNIKDIILFSYNLNSVTPEMIKKYNPSLIGLMNSSLYVGCKDLYLPDDFIKIQEAANDIIYKSNASKEGIRDIDKFLGIYKLLGEILEYDTVVVRSLSSINDHNLLGLLRGRTACEGFAKILTEILTLAEIDSTVIIGNYEGQTISGAHAWNKVVIDGKWYNCDLSGDSVLIREGAKPDTCLLTDEEFEKGGYIFGDKSKIDDLGNNYELSQENYDQDEIDKFFEKDHNPIADSIKKEVLSPRKMVEQIAKVKRSYSEPIYLRLYREDKEHYGIQFRRRLHNGMTRPISDESPSFEVAKRGEFLEEYQKQFGIAKAKKGIILSKGLVLSFRKDEKKKIKEDSVIDVELEESGER